MFVDHLIQTSRSRSLNPAKVLDPMIIVEDMLSSEFWCLFQQLMKIMVKAGF